MKARTKKFGTRAVAMLAFGNDGILNVSCFGWCRTGEQLS